MDTLNPHGLQEHLPGVDDSSLQASLGEQAAGLTALLDAHRHGLRRIGTDPGLNDYGRREKERQHGEQTLATIDQLEGKRWGDWSVESIAKDIERQQVILANRLDFKADGLGLSKYVPTAERPLAELRERELRDRLLQLSPTDRHLRAIEAATSNDLELLRAIEHAPASFPILTPEQKAEVDRLHIERHHPETAKRIKALENLQATMTFNVNGARATVRGRGVNGAKDTVRLRAVGDGAE